jgi:hypothetical protein
VGPFFWPLTGERRPPRALPEPPVLFTCAFLLLAHCLLTPHVAGLNRMREVLNCFSDQTETPLRGIIREDAMLRATAN